MSSAEIDPAQGAAPIRRRGLIARRVLAALIFLSLFVLTIGGSHTYLATRLAIEPAWPSLVWRAIVSVLVLGFAALVIHAFLRRRLGVISRSLAWASYTWLGFMFILLIVTLASDVVLAAMAFAVAPESHPDEIVLARGRALAVALLSLAAGGYALAEGLRKPEVRRVEIALDRWPEALNGFRVVQISDIHIGPILDHRFSRYLAARVNALEPDLVAVTGDVVDGRVSRLASHVEPFRALQARHGVFFVTGNHDYYSGADEWEAFLTDFGWRSLRNEHVTIHAQGGAFDLAGVDDRQGAMMDGSDGEDIALALSNRDPDRAVVLLAHDPGSFKRALEHEIDLQISGHTHGGQIWPFNWAVRAVIPWVRGHHRIASSQLYVSCGTGFWGPPMRLGAPAEITELVLRRS